MLLVIILFFSIWPFSLYLVVSILVFCLQIHVLVAMTLPRSSYCIGFLSLFVNVVFVFFMDSASVMFGWANSLIILLSFVLLVVCG